MRKPLYSSFLAALMLTCTTYALAKDSHRLVLAAHKDSPISSLTQGEVRQLFLGRNLVKDGHAIQPIINTSDQLLYEVFLQKIVFMSARSYERHMLSRVFRRGGQRPPIYSDPRLLIQSLADTPGGVSFMWQENAQRAPNIVVIKELWRGSIR